MSPRRTSRACRAWVLAGACLGLSACGAKPADTRGAEEATPTAPATEAAPNTQAAPNTPAASTPADDAPAPLRCEGPTDLRDLAWLPATARLGVWVHTGADDLAPALSRLSNYVRDGEHALPVMVDLDLSMLGTELTVVRDLLTRLGLNPAALLKLHDPSRRPVWVVPAPCDLGALRAAMTRAWGLSPRETVGAWIASAPPDSAFPFDVLLMTGDRMLLVPRGTAVPVRAWLDRDAPREGAAAGGAGSELSIGAAMQQLRDAAVVVAVSGRGLLSTGAGDGAGGDATHERVRTIQAFGERLAFDAHLGDTATP